MIAFEPGRWYGPRGHRVWLACREDDRLTFVDEDGRFLLYKACRIFVPGIGPCEGTNADDPGLAAYMD